MEKKEEVIEVTLSPLERIAVLVAASIVFGVIGITSLLVLIITFARTSGMVVLTAILLVSCSPKLSAVLPEGEILDRDTRNNRALVLFKDHYGKPGDFFYSWVLNSRMDTLQHDSYVEIVFKNREVKP